MPNPPASSEQSCALACLNYDMRRRDVRRLTITLGFRFRMSAIIFLRYAGVWSDFDRALLYAQQQCRRNGAVFLGRDQLKPDDMARRKQLTVFVSYNAVSDQIRPRFRPEGDRCR